jgi:hypothetical protein
MGSKRPYINGKFRITSKKYIGRIGDSYHPEKWYTLERRWLWFFWIRVLTFETKEMAESYLQALIDSQNE